jgi:type IV secretory pathway VirD2 relaxase
MEALEAAFVTALITGFAGGFAVADDDFALWLGRIGRDRSYLGRVRRATNLAGGLRATRGAARRFTGARIGRGSGVARVLASSDRFAGSRSRRVIVKTSYVKLAGKGVARAVAHLRYLQRDGTTREGERGTLYGAETEIADGKAFLERGSGDRHQFRFIVAAEDGAEYDDLKPMIRRLMRQAEQDLGTRLDWVAVDHFNTGHPHSHILLRGKDERGADLVIAPEYLTQGLRARATAIVDLDLGPRSDVEIQRAQAREVTQERFTQIDRRLIAAIDADGLVSPAHADGIEQAARAGRLQTLGRMGLATEERRGRWRLDAELEATPKEMGRRGDIIATLHQRLAQERSAVPPADYAIYDPTDQQHRVLVGRVLATGLSDEHADRRYLILEGADGRAWHVDVGLIDELPGHRSIVRLAGAGGSIRPVDRTVAEIAAANDGRYSVDLHLAHDPSASQTFAETHVRRLEAIRRTTGGVTREPDGSWTIAPDHLERVAAFEQERARRQPVMIEMLSSQPLKQLPCHDGATWLDRELTSTDPLRLERGFGAEVRAALRMRQQWLVEQGLATGHGDAVRPVPDVLNQLQRRELMRVGAQLGRELGLDFVEAKVGETVTGTFRRAVQVGDAKFALVEKAREFTLVPWRPALEKQVGQTVSGILREAGRISWTIGRGRGIGIG